MVLTADGPIRGLAVDLDTGGALVVEAVDGQHVIASGEVVRLRPEDAA